jgi:hypothetical protein
MCTAIPKERIAAIRYGMMYGSGDGCIFKSSILKPDHEQDIDFF